MFKQHPKVWSAVREYGIITVATLIMVIGIYVFKFPNNFSFGGVSGMAVLLAKLTSISAGNWTFLLNMALLVLLAAAALGVLRAASFLRPGF